MRRFVVVVLAGLVLASVACGAGSKAAPNGQPKESAGDAAKRQFTALANGQFGREWDELHPAQQAVVSRGMWETCAGKAGLPQIQDITIKETYDDPLSIQSVPEHAAKAVTVSYVYALASGKTPHTDTLHEVNVTGQWRWVLGDEAMAAYRAGKCP